MKRYVGERYERLIVTKLEPGWVLCRCDCGTDHQVKPSSWGRIKSCGCARRDWAGALNLSHGLTGSRTWVSWQAMIQRCTNPAASDYSRYGGAGVTVNPLWLDFAQFLADMGERPAERTLDRVDNSDGYRPGNCRWATTSEQNLNKRYPLRTLCRRGHPLTDDNVLIEGTKRRCKTCRESYRLKNRLRGALAVDGG